MSQEVKYLNVKSVLLATIATLINVECFALQRDPNDPWWFEIEAIIFERSQSPEEINEEFDLTVKPINTNGLESFTLATLQPNITLIQQTSRICLQPELQIEFPQQTAPAPTIDFALGHATMEEMSQVLAYALEQPPIFMQEIIAQENLSNANYVVSKRPSEKLAKYFDNRFYDIKDEYTEFTLTTVFDVAYPRFAKANIEPSDSPKFRVPQTLYCQWPVEKEMFASVEAQQLKEARYLASINVKPDGIDYPFSDVAYTLPAEALKLTTLKRQIQRSRGLNVLLHTAWRQDVKVGRDNAPWYRLSAGDNYSRNYLYTGIPRSELPPEENNEATVKSDIVAQISAIVSSENSDSLEQTPPAIWQSLLESPLNQEFQEVWTLDGRLRIFIEYIGGTPYLHIDSELNYRLPIFVDWETQDKPLSVAASQEVLGDNNAITPSMNMLQPFYFDQLRRVISNEIHYFDHPLFGMVFQVRRYKRPAPPEPEDVFVIDQASVR